MAVSVFPAATWIERLLTGQVAVITATIAVAILGLTVMAGRLSIRRGVEILIGIFLIFGAPVVAGGLLGEKPQRVDLSVPAQQAAPLDVARPAASAYDPYAGASVPQNRASSDIPGPSR